MRAAPLMPLITLILSIGIAHAQDSFPSTTAALAEPALVGMRLSVKHGVSKGSASTKRLQCVEALPPDSFFLVVVQLLPQYLAPADLRATEAFFTTSVGRKYVRHGVLQIYQAVGEPLPSPLPTFSDSEYKELESFAATKAGEQLLKYRVMQSANSRRAFDARIRELLAQCPN